MSDMFSMNFDARSLAEIAQFYSFPVYLSEETQVAMQEAGQLVTAAAVAKTWEVFQNPSGQLASSIHAVTASPYEVQIGSDLPYAARREYGFQNKTDSLGRTFPNDIARPYMEPALEENKDAVLQLVEGGAQRALDRLGGNA